MRASSENLGAGNRHPRRAACGGEPASATSILVTFETPSGSFIARIVDAVSIDRAREALDEGGSAGIPNGRILEGDGAVNTGHNWHLEDVELVDVTIEACDGTADFVDENLDVYLDLGNYCHWSAVVVAIERE
ncbi:MAG TPA: hypothetical protein VM848_12400 [Acidimicrobiia bacterium]|nr:hypothetical protein [Acidimicrobiia bacterium]